MIRKFTMVAALAVTVGLLAQNQPVSPNQAAPQLGAMVVPSTNIYGIGGGLSGGVYVAGDGVAAASESTPGISLADRAGISLNRPSELTVEGTLTPSGPAYGYGYPAGPPAAAEAPGPSNDLMPSYFAGSTPSAGVPPISLGEIAALYRTRCPKKARVFANTDTRAAAETLECCDLGPSYLEDPAPSEIEVPSSLGEIAAQYRNNRPKNVRTYTNVDALRLSAGW